jgi:hypothetical protein
MPTIRILGCALALATLGCTTGARNVDYSPSRAIAADVAASHATGAIGSRPGRALRDEPYDAYPWELDERHQTGR